MTLLDGKLPDLLWNTWDRETTDPRDKVFAVLGLVGDEDTRLLTSPDYGKGVRQVARARLGGPTWRNKVAPVAGE